jgi:hypothetical protein
MNVRIIILTIACLALAAGMVFADLNGTIGYQGSLATGTYTFTDPQNNATTLTFTPSTNVTVGINSVAQSYAANSKHLNGDREFGTASDSTAIFWQSSEKGTSLSAAPSNSDASAFSGWNSL